MKLEYRRYLSHFLSAVLILGFTVPAVAHAQSSTAQSATGVQNQSSTPAPAKTAGKSSTSATPARTPPSPGMVWANTDSKVYHKSGSRWYGKTKQGQWMTEADAQKAGYKAASN